MKKYLIIIGLVLFLANCQNNKQEAQASLEKARGFYEKAEYGSAKQVLDEIKTNYPKITDLQEERLHLMRLIELKEQERNLNYCDSMLMIFQNEASRFPKENPTASDDSQPLRIGVNEDGGMYIISSYTGATPLHHNQLKVSLVSGEYVETEAIPFDGGANYSFKDDNNGLIHEWVTYQKGRDNGVIAFIYNHSTENLTAEYLGGKRYAYRIPASVIESVKQTVDRSAVLSEIRRLEQEKTKAEKRILYLRGKLEN